MMSPPRPMVTPKMAAVAMGRRCLHSSRLIRRVRPPSMTWSNPLSRRCEPAKTVEVQRDEEPRTIGRLAPSPTGGLHLGHARTFLIAWLAARHSGGRIVLRIEDLDATRVRHEATAAMLVDLHWLGFTWDEGPDIGGPAAPYVQSQRTSLYAAVLDRLKAAERVYPCTCTRADIARAASALMPRTKDQPIPAPAPGKARPMRILSQADRSRGDFAFLMAE